MSLTKKFSKSKPVCKVTFKLPKEAVVGAQKVVLLGEFNGWDTTNGITLKPAKDGSFKTAIELETGRDYQFRYLINDTEWENDWNADDYVRAPYDGVYNSVVFIPSNTPETIAKGVINNTPVNKKATAKVAAKSTAKKKATAKVAAKSTTKKKATAKSPAKKTATAKVAAKPTAKKTVKKAAPVKKKATQKIVKKITIKADMLRKVEGIGPKIETLLNKGGIYTFQKLSETKVTDLRNILKAAGSRYQMHEPKTWPKQAKLAATGKWDKLKVLQDKLKGGK